MAQCFLLGFFVFPRLFLRCPLFFFVHKVLFIAKRAQETRNGGKTQDRDKEERGSDLGLQENMRGSRTIQHCASRKCPTYTSQKHRSERLTERESKPALTKRSDGVEGREHKENRESYC